MYEFGKRYILTEEGIGNDLYQVTVFDTVTESTVCTETVDSYELDDIKEELSEYYWE